MPIGGAPAARIQDRSMAAPLLALETRWSRMFDSLALEWRRLFSGFLVIRRG